MPDYIITEPANACCKCGGKLQIVTAKMKIDRGSWYKYDNFRCECLACEKATPWFPSAEGALKKFKDDYVGWIYDMPEIRTFITPTKLKCACGKPVVCVTEKTVYEDMHRYECIFCKQRTDWFDDYEKALGQWLTKNKKREERDNVKALKAVMERLNYRDEYIDSVLSNLPAGNEINQ